MIIVVLFLLETSIDYHYSLGIDNRTAWTRVLTEAGQFCPTMCESTPYCVDSNSRLQTLPNDSSLRLAHYVPCTTVRSHTTYHGKRFTRFCSGIVYIFPNEAFFFIRIFIMCFSVKVISSVTVSFSIKLAVRVHEVVHRRQCRSRNTGVGRPVRGFE